MVISPTYERYCRERKATLNNERSIVQNRSMSEVVEEILEIISTDEDVLRNSKRDTSVLLSNPSGATWSLSSSAIMSSWPSISTTEDESDSIDNVQKSIQSYTSQLFSPLYEVRLDQQNVFEENRQPLPKPGHTPKLRNLCYNLGTQLSFEQTDFDSDVGEYLYVDKPKNRGLGSKNQRAHNAAERILSNVSPLTALSTAQVGERDLKAFSDTVVSPNYIQLESPMYNIERKDSKNFQSIHSSQDAKPKQEPIHFQTKMSMFERDNFARKDWILKSSSSTESGELSLEPLLNAYSDDYQEAGGITKFRENFSKKGDEAVENIKVDFKDCSQDCPCGMVEKLKPQDKCVRIDEVQTTHQGQNITTKHENDRHEKYDIEDNKRRVTKGSAITNLRIVNDLVFKNHVLLQRIIFHVPYISMASTVLDTGLFTEHSQSINMESSSRCAVLVRDNNSKMRSQEIIRHNPAAPTFDQLNLVKYDRATNSNTDGCFLLDFDSFCVLFGNWEQAINSHNIRLDGCTKSNDSIPHSKEKDERPNTFKSNDSAELLCSGHHEENVSLEDDISQIIYFESDDPGDDNIINNVIKDDELRQILKNSGSDEDGSALFPSYSSDSPPTSFDSEQFLKDMAVRIESELSNRGITFDDDDATTSTTVFQALSANLYSSSNESDDGLDEEIGALQMFEINLKNEIDKANDQLLERLPLTSPMQTFLSSKSSNCSMTTTFLSDFDLSVCQSNDVDMFDNIPNVRKVHFNEQVEEFFYAAHDACGTPDASKTKHHKKEETFFDEICTVFDDIIDDINFVCICFSNAMDRTKHTSQRRTIRRSSVS